VRVVPQEGDRGSALDVAHFRANVGADGVDVAPETPAR